MIETMSIWNSNIKKQNLPLYQAIAETIRDGIQNGDLKPGDQLPPHRKLADQIGVTIGTVARGYNLAASWGLVSGEIGRGTIVAAPESDYAHVPLNLNAAYFDLGIIKPTSTTDAVLRKQAYEDTLKKIGLRWKNKAFTGFSPEFGLAQYREAGASWIANLGIKASVDEVLLTGGAQEAFHLLLTNLTAPGDSILVEEITHALFKELASILNLKMIGISMDDQGIVPDSLLAACKKSQAHVLFITPTYHSPTTAIMSQKRREQIVDIAQRNNFFIIENGIFSSFALNAPPPIATMCPERAAYVTSLSFCASPEIRVGYLKTQKKNIPKLQAIKRALTVSASMIPAEIATHWISSGILDKLVKWQIHEIRARAEIAGGILDGLDYRYSPDGMFIWLLLPEPWRVTDFTKAAKERNTIVMESERFVIGRGTAPHAIRISLTSAQTRDLLVDGLKIIVDLVNSPSKFDPLI
mgnify:CR=1 FL=1|jgi:DNA-binding transcriptional MocR family regulator